MTTSDEPARRVPFVSDRVGGPVRSRRPSFLFDFTGLAGPPPVTEVLYGVKRFNNG